MAKFLVELRDDLHKRLKIASIIDGITLKSIVDRALIREVEFLENPFLLEAYNGIRHGNAQGKVIEDSQGGDGITRAVRRDARGQASEEEAQAKA